MKLALVGATGLVGTELIKMLEESTLQVDAFIPSASEKSIGKEIVFKGKTYKIVSVEDLIAMKPDVAIFSAGSDASLKYAPQFAAVKCKVVDNSSAWRMNQDVPLVIPEINANSISKDQYIIANPNCSTTQMVMVLGPLDKKFGVERVVVSTYQSVTGTGVKAVKQLEDEEQGIVGERAYKHQIYRNCIPQCDVFLDNGYTKEEMKLINETKKILNNETINVTATAVRVPVVGGHSESVNITLKNDMGIDAFKAVIASSVGVVIMDNPETGTYPMPIHAEGKNDVFVGRIRKDFSAEKSYNLWIVADNLRKGAATNAIQIVEWLEQNGHLNQ